MSKIFFYGLPNCTTCQKALRRLDYHRVPEVEKRNIKEEPLTREEIEKLAAMLGGVENLFSRRSVKYRELGLRDKELSETDMLDLMENEYTFLKRPILVAGNKAVAGFFEKIYDDFLAAENQKIRSGHNG
jgi:arsenate reductase